MFYMHVHVQAMIHDPARNSVFYSVQIFFPMEVLGLPLFYLFLEIIYGYVENINVDVNYETKWNFFEIYIPFFRFSNLVFYHKLKRYKIGVFRVDCVSFVTIINNASVQLFCCPESVF